MEFYTEILKHFVYCTIALSITAVSGGIVLRLISFINPHLKDVKGLIRFILCYATGLVVLPTIYAAFHTSGKTVLWIGLAAFLYFVANVKPTQFSFMPLSFKPIIFYFVASFMLVALIIFDFHSVYIYKKPFWDHAFYTTLFQSMKAYECESVLAIPSIATQDCGYFLYHYYDLWLAALFDQIFNICGINAYMIVASVNFYFGIAILAYYIAFRLTSCFCVSIFLGFAYIFLATGFGIFSDIFGYRSIATDLFSIVDSYYSPVKFGMSFKYLPLYFFLLLASYFYAMRDILSFVLLVLVSLVFNVGLLLMVVLLLVWITIFLVLKFRIIADYRKMTYFHSLIFISLILIFLFIPLLITEKQNSIAIVKIPSESLFQRIKLILFDPIYYSLIKTIFFFFSHLVIIAFIWKHMRFFFRNYLTEIFFLTVLFAGSHWVYLTIFLATGFEDAHQFWHTPLIIGGVLIFWAVVKLLASTKSKLTWILIVLPLTAKVYHILLFTNQEKSKNKFDTSFLTSILSEHISNSIGAFLADYESTKNKKIFHTDFFIGYIKSYTDKYLTAIPLYDIHVPIDSSSTRELAIQRQFLFLNYYQNIKKVEPYISEREAQIRFMKERNIDWIYLHNTYTWPTEWDVYVRKKIIDPNTKDMMIYLKPWE
ncbi:MAG: hypothetical protein RMM53_04485 [Bacteroidia bacterium]|nr:hypothetical protein [Bacteroidia bacterium]